MQINYLAILLATIIQFIIGAIWYSFLFGKLWARIHGFDKLPKEVQQKMMKAMGPFYGIQFVMTLITTIVLEILILSLPHDWSPYGLAVLLWLGFVVPVQVSAVIFGGTESKWILKKVAVQAGAAFFCLEAAAAVLHLL
jgi:hypothetical protein